MSGLGSNWLRLQAQLSSTQPAKRLAQSTSLDQPRSNKKARRTTSAQAPPTSLEQPRSTKKARRTAAAQAPPTSLDQPRSTKKARRRAAKARKSAAEPVAPEVLEQPSAAKKVTAKARKAEKRGLNKKRANAALREKDGNAVGERKVKKTAAKLEKRAKSRKAPPLDSAIRAELGRWRVLDSVVRAYDRTVSPVLGGGDSGRNEQKRKRHLEAWLWARLFHPLLPLGEPSPASAALGDETLARKLQNAGLRPEEARSRVRGLAELLQASAGPVDGDVKVEVAVEEQGDKVALTCGGRAVELLLAYSRKLRGLYSGQDFHKALFLLLARYRILQVHDKGGGNQGAVPEAVFRALQDWAGQPVVEGFASPLNTLAAGRNYHSAFADVDSAFGSRGSFFGGEFSEGVVEVNPPFDEDMVQRVADVIQKSLSRAARAGKSLMFCVIVPETDWPGHASLLASPFLRWVSTLLSGGHFYQVGNQHLNATRAYPASRNTTVLLLASRPVAGMTRLRKFIEAAFRTRPT